MWTNRFLIVLLTASACLLGGFSMASASVGEGNGVIEDFMRKFFTEIDETNKIEERKKRDAELIELVQGRVDISWVANFILGKHRRGVDSQQKKRFIDLYSKYLKDNYRLALNVYKKDNYSIISIEPKNKAFMVTTSVLFNGRVLKNIFRIVKKGNNYYITDVITEGISFITAKRTELDSTVTARGFDAFLQDLESRVSASGYGNVS